MRTGKDNDPLLLFSWECPETVASLCDEFKIPLNKNKIFILKFSNYKKLIDKPTRDFEFFIKLKLTKDNRYAEKTLTFILKKPIENSTTSNQGEINKKEDHKVEIKKEIDLTDLIVIENEFMGTTDLLFKSSLLDPNIDMLKYKFQWTISHFKSDSLYLNGRKEINLRIKYADLLNGINDIEYKIINPETQKEFKKNIKFEKGLPPYGGSCFVSPSTGISFLTEFTFYVSDWKSTSLPLFYKIKYLDKNNIPIDISNGGFVGDKFISNKLPVANNFILEIIDNKGISTNSNCNLNVKTNKNIKPIDFYIQGVFDIPQQLLINDLYKTNKNENDKQELEEINKAVDIIDIYFNSIDQDKFNTEYDIIISTLIAITTNFDDKKIDTINKILNLIIKFIDPLLNNLVKLQYLYSVLDNMNNKFGTLLESKI